jgi:hypothetical protein
VPKDHYLPASVIGRFSNDTRSRARERVVFVARKGRSTASPARAETVGYVNNLYRADTAALFGDNFHDEDAVDPALNGYEPNLPLALDLLEAAQPLPMETWLRTLVPYVTSTFVRGSDFAPRFMARPGVPGLVSMDNANAARFIELERLLAPVCCARWVVWHKSAGEPLVLNNLGLTGTLDSGTGQPGWAIPISKSCLLSIYPRPRRSVAIYQDDAWWPLIKHVTLGADQARGFNDAMAHMATSYVVGATAELVERLAPLIGEHANESALMDAWPFDHRTRLAHAKDWHRLVSATAVNRPPDQLTDLQRVDPAALGSSWCPPLGFLLNVREFPTGLRLDGNVIHLTLDVPPDYESYIGSSARSA